MAKIKTFQVRPMCDAHQYPMHTFGKRRILRELPVASSELVTSRY